MDWLSNLIQTAVSISDKAPVFRAVLGVLLVFFIPGFAWTFIFFKKLHPLERLVFSFALSTAMTTLSIVFSNVVFHARINGLNSLLIIIILTIIPVVIQYAVRRFKNLSAPEKQA